MNITVRYHAAARELCGLSSEVVELAPPHSPTPQVLLRVLGDRYPRFGPYVGRMRCAVNGDFAELAQSLRDGDEVDILPPVAGGGPAVTVDVRSTELTLDEALRTVSHPSCGGVSLFVGTVRNVSSGRTVHRLDYEAQEELACKEMRRILEVVLVESGSVRLCAFHRVGQLSVGDVAVVVAASAPHRAQAIMGCRLAIDRIKATVPIWKKEWTIEGDACWVGLDEYEAPVREDQPRTVRTI